MDSTTISVSKGCFVFKNGLTRADKKITRKTATKRKRNTTESADGNGNGGLLGKNITDQPFYRVYTELWQRLEAHIERLQKGSYARTLAELVSYIASETNGNAKTYGTEEILPAAALLTGINQPDHLEQFEALSQRIRKNISASVCVLQSRDCATLKAAVETMVYNFIEAPHEDIEVENHKRLRRSQCNIKQLKLWYSNNYYSKTRKLQEKQKNHEQSDSSENENALQSEEEQNEIAASKRRQERRCKTFTSASNSQQPHSLVVILPDFECFNVSVLQDFILILSSHCAQLPFVLVLGVATAISAVHSTLPYHVTSKIKLSVFQMQAAPVGLNEILDKVILSPKYAFHLSGKAFKFLTHIFLYYDFSINGFIRGFKYCLMEHYFQGNAYALCSGYSASLTKIKCMTHDDMETIRRLLSFRPYVESINDCKRIISILTDDSYLKKKLPQLLRDCHVHFMLLRTFLEFLTALVDDLPKCPLGKYRRELYALCLSKELIEQAEYKECWQMLSFMSKEEFVAKINKAIKATNDFFKTEIKMLELANDCERIVNEKMSAIKELLAKVAVAGMEAKAPEAANVNSTDALKQLSSRHDLKERLLQMSKQEKPISDFTKSVNEILSYIQTEIVAHYLRPLERAPPLHELFIFNDIATVRRHIIGAPRAALHMALNNPHFYLQCKCCHLQEHSQLLTTLPDLSVVYKLHLECGRMINLFDWLQAFRAVVDFSEDEQEQVNPLIQARFTRAVAELQFLGYIKMSKRKTDHATRLTW